MARAQRDKAARSDGDVVYGSLVPLVGSLAGAALALRSVSRTVAEPLRALWTQGYGASDATSLLTAGSFLVGRAGGFVLLGAASGGLVAGLLQTRGYFGRPTPQAAQVRATPSAWLALLGWAGLLGVAIFTLRIVIGLHPAEPLALGHASLELETRFAMLAFGFLAVIALIDHGLKLQARNARLGLDEPEPRSRAVVDQVVVPTPREDELLVGARWVVFDASRALIIGMLDGQPFVTARVDGAQVDALCNAARARGLAPRQVVDLSDADRASSDIALSTQRLLAWGIVLPSVGVA